MALPLFLKVRQKREIDLVYRKGRKIEGDFFTLRFLILPQKGLQARFNVIISTKVSKKSVERNKKKRQMHEILRLSSNAFAKDWLFLIIMKPSCLGADYQTLQADFLKLARKIGLVK